MGIFANLLRKRPAAPQFKLKMLGAQIFVLPTSTGIVIDATVWNLGKPAAIVGWELTVVPAGPVMPEKSPVYKMGDTMMLKGATPQDTVMLYGANSLETKTLKPVENTPVGGHLLFQVQLDKATVMKPTTRFTLAAEDIYGERTEISKTLAEWLHA